MKYPNLRYGNPNEFRYYIQGQKITDVARRLRRSERIVRNWLSGRTKLPWWVPELMRLQQLEYQIRAYEMNMAPVAQRLGIVAPSAQVYEFRKHRDKLCELSTRGNHENIYSISRHHSAG